MQCDLEDFWKLFKMRFGYQSVYVIDILIVVYSYWGLFAVAFIWSTGYYLQKLGCWMVSDLNYNVDLKMTLRW